jgi:tellurite resistance protein
LRAVAGAFVLVAAADGELSRAEADRFIEVLRSKADVFAPIDFAELARAFGDLSEAMLADPEDGKRLALQYVARVKGVPRHAELVKSAAEIAAAADGRLQAVEESVMQDVRGALGMGAGRIPQL